MKQMRLARSRGRMMASVPDATVIITNPTHYAVALRYEQGMQAPICVAKGVDHLALRIRKLANEHDVPIVENPPLARALHASVEIEDEIPVEHYKAVAEVIGYVFAAAALSGISDNLSRRSTIHGSIERKAPQRNRQIGEVRQHLAVGAAWGGAIALPGAFLALTSSATTRHGL